MKTYGILIVITGLISIANATEMLYKPLVTIPAVINIVLGVGLVIFGIALWPQTPQQDPGDWAVGLGDKDCD